MMNAPGPTLADALTAALSAEYAAVYGYGVVGAHERGVARIRAARAMAWHQGRRPVLSAALSAAGAEVPTAQPAYVLPFPVTNSVSAGRLATALEDGVAAAYANLVSAAEGGTRQDAATALAQCATRAAQWRGYSVPFPGLPERAATGSG
jgi:hypothetical protein